MTEMDYGSGAWQWAHSDVFAGSKLLATYCATGTAYCNTSTPTTFALSDWLGTKRVEATAAGGIDGNGQDTYASLPYGDQEFNGTGATEHFYTGKERDTESGNDYFGARYYSSAMGRWMSPDKPFADQHVANPQSWNLFFSPSPARPGRSRRRRCATPASPATPRPLQVRSLRLGGWSAQTAAEGVREPIRIGRSTLGDDPHGQARAASIDTVSFNPTNACNGVFFAAAMSRCSLNITSTSQPLRSMAR